MADFNPAPIPNESNQAALQQFNQSFNQSFNEQFNKDYKIQQDLIENNPKFLRTRQSIEAERRNVIGAITDNSPYNLYEENKLKSSTFRKQALTGVLECNLLNQVFFSQENVDLLQDKIRYAVWMASNKKFIIDKQSEVDLQLIMKSIYLQYAKNIPHNIKEQVADLNDLTLQDCVPKILSGVEQHMYYLFDASTQPVPLSLPENMSSAGRKILPSVTSTFFV